MKKMIDMFAECDDVISEVADTYGLRCYWGSKRRVLGNTIQDSLSILREINIDNFKVILGIQVSFYNDNLADRTVLILADDSTDMELVNKDRVTFEVENYIDMITDCMHESFEYLYQNLVYASLELVGYVENKDLGKGTNLATVPDFI